MATILFEANGCGISVRATVQVSDAVSAADLSGLVREVSEGVKMQFRFDGCDDDDDGDAWKRGKVERN